GEAIAEEVENGRGVIGGYVYRALAENGRRDVLLIEIGQELRFVQQIARLIRRPEFVVGEGAGGKALRVPLMSEVGRIEIVGVDDCVSDQGHSCVLLPAQAMYQPPSTFMACPVM